MSDINADSLYPLLGSNWRLVFKGQAQLLAYLSGLAEAENDVELSLDRAIAAVSRLTSPLLRRQRWHRLSLRESERNVGDLTSYRYGDGALYGAGQQYGAQRRISASRFPLPAGLVAAPFAVNRMTSPSLCWVHGIDYTIDVDLKFIEFVANPFDDSLIPQRGLYANGEEVDRELELWLYRPDYDEDLYYRQWGYVLDLYGASTSNYRDAVNAAWDCLVEGVSTLRMRQFVAAVLDIPISTGDETVQEIFEDHGQLCVATESKIYRYHGESTATVAVGDALQPGQTLTDSLRFDRFGTGQVPYGVTGITLDRPLFGTETFGGIFFPDEAVETVVTTDAYGYTELRFPLGGWPADVDWLFDTLQARGRANGTTPAMLLDRRENKTGQPSASNLPATINPAEFVVENVLRNNASMIRIDANHVGPNALPLSYLRRLPQLIPPHTTALIEFSAAAAADVFDPDDFTDEVTPFCSVTADGDELDPDLVDDVVTARYIDGVCL